MPRALTSRERIYLEMLIARNAGLLERKDLPESEREGLWCSPFQKPATAKERKTRERIRKKALMMAADLSNIFQAGLFPKNRKDECTSPEKLVRDFSSLAALRQVTQYCAKRDNQPVTKEVI